MRIQVFLDYCIQTPKSETDSGSARDVLRSSVREYDKWTNLVHHENLIQFQN